VNRLDPSGDDAADWRDLRFRRAEAADAAAVRTLTRAAYARWCPVIGREPKPMTADYDAAVRDHLIDLALEDGRLVALIEMIPRADHLLVENVAVSPEAQGRGLGRLLMQRAERRAAALALPQVRLYTNKAFDVNLRFYEALSYGVDREEPFKGGIVVHLSKAIGPL